MQTLEHRIYNLMQNQQQKNCSSVNKQSFFAFILQYPEAVLLYSMLPSVSIS